MGRRAVDGLTVAGILQVMHDERLPLHASISTWLGRACLTWDDVNTTTTGSAAATVDTASTETEPGKPGTQPLAKAGTAIPAAAAKRETGDDEEAWVWQ